MRRAGRIRATSIDVPDIYIAMGQTAENVAQLKGICRAMQDEFGCRSAESGRKGRGRGFWHARSRRSRCRTAQSSTTTTGPASGTDPREV